MTPETLELFKWLIPAVAIVIIAFLAINRPVQMEKIKQKSIALRETHKILTPAKLSALERLTLLMQRITPEAMIMRQNVGIMRVDELQLALLTSLREEFDHNTSQQLYVSEETWEAVVKAKDAITQAVNKIASSLPADASATVLAERLISFYAALEDTPTEEASDCIREELNKLEHNEPTNAE